MFNVLTPKKTVASVKQVLRNASLYEVQLMIRVLSQYHAFYTREGMGADHPQAKALAESVAMCQARYEELTNKVPTLVASPADDCANAHNALHC